MLEKPHDEHEKGTSLFQPIFSQKRLFLGFQPPVSNTTYTPNQFFDVTLKHSSRGCARVVSYLIRRSLGWVDEWGNPHDERIQVTYNELIEKAGIGRTMLRSALDEAIERRFINCPRQGKPSSPGRKAISALYELRWDESPGYKTDPAQFDGFFAQEGNRTYIPNEFFDLVVRHENLAVIKVVGAVIRNTIGWTHRAGHRRQNVRLSFTDIQHRTLLQSRTTLSEALKEALEKNYILKIEQGFFDPQAGFESKPTTYGIKWLTSHALTDTGSEIVPEYKNWTGSEIVPGKTDPNRSGNRTGTGSEIVPEDRFGNRTDINS